MKIVLIGAGSHSFGRGQIADILQAPELRGRGVTLALVDMDERALETMTRLAERLKAHVDSDITLESTTDRRRVLPGARYIVTAVARQRMALWEQDYRVPLAHGFRHCLGENGGPGAVFHALRSFELILPICRDIEELCPDALLMNFTNPEARVLHAICHLTKVRAAGFCHGVFSGLHLIERLLGRPVTELDVISAGMNHFYNILQVRDRRAGADLRPELVRRALADESLRAPLWKKLLTVFDVFSYPSDDHIGEYLAYGSDLSGVHWKYGLESRPVSLAPTASPGPTLEDYAYGRAPLDGAITRVTEELTVPIICDIEFDRGSWRPAVNVLNREGYITNLPVGGVVEVPATVDAGGIHPHQVDALSEPYAAMIRTQFAIIDLVTEAYRTRCRKLLLQALLMDPVVNSIHAAERLLDEMLVLQREYLPSFA